MTPRILIFSIAMDADNSFYLKFIPTYAPTFFGYIISVLAIVHHEISINKYFRQNFKDIFYTFPRPLFQTF